MMPARLAAMLTRVDKNQERLNAHRPFPQNTLASLRDKLALEWTYNSNAIEGNTLTLRETKVVLEGITVGGKSVLEHLEATNHREAIYYIEQIVRDKEPLSEWQIKNLHSLVLKGIDHENAGRYRQENVVISGASTTPPDFLHLDEEMLRLMEWHELAESTHPVIRATELHTRFVEIHPFIDGNGRTGRLLLNFELMKSGYPPAIIRKEDRLAYYDALDKACTSNDYSDITQLVTDAIDRSQTTYLSLVEHASPKQTQPTPTTPGSSPDFAP